jgi:predicted nucleic acid-binding protein
MTSSRPTVAAATSLRGTGIGAARFHSSACPAPGAAEAPPNASIPAPSSAAGSAFIATEYERASVFGVTRFVVDCETLLRIAAGEAMVAAEHKLVAPTLVRSQALAAMYEAARRGEISAAEGVERVTRINSLKVRFLGDKVLQRTAWQVADQLGWETTYDAEFVALTQLQADVFVTSDGDLARAVSGLVETATIDALRKG